MYKKLFLILLILLPLVIYAQNVKVTSFTKDASDMTARVTDAVTDQNGDKCALIKMQTPQKGFVFEGDMLGITKTQQKTGEVWVYVPAKAKRLVIKHPDFGVTRYVYESPIEEAAVYIMKLSMEEGASSTLPVTIILAPANATLTVNGKTPEGIAPTYQLPKGKNVIQITANGYQTHEKEIEVSESKAYFNFTLEKQQDAAVQITSIPEGARVLLDQVELGVTPIAAFYPPGTYAVKLVKDGYLEYEEQIVIATPQTKKQYILEENVGYLTIKTTPGAKVTLNGDLVEETNRIKLRPQLVKVKVSMPKAAPLEQQVILKRNDAIVLEMYPEVQTGTIQVAVSPFDATIELSGDAGEFYTATGTKIFNAIPVGMYTLKVVAEGYLTQEQQISLAENQKVTQNIQLKAGKEKSTDGLLTDIDGNVYKTVKIGAQVWMAENLKVTRYADGSAIPHVTDNTEWANLGDNNTDKAYCFYDNDESSGFGALYTYAAATNGDNSGNNVQGACPDGWHLPSDAEWTELENYLANNGYNYDETKGGGRGKIAKALASQTGWNITNGVGAVGNNRGSNNTSGFSALPGGYRNSGSGAFNGAGSYGYWWSSTQNSSSSAYYRFLSYSRSNVYRYGSNKSYGFSGRCLRD